MRCLILIALCFALANASYYNKNRFQNLLNRYQQNQRGQNQNRYHLGQWDQDENQFGSDDEDDYIGNYVDEIRRERMFDRDQCPRGLENILGLDEEEYGNYDMQDLFRGQRQSGDLEDMIRNRQHHGEDREDMDDMIRGRQYWGEETQGLGQRFDDEDSTTRSPLLKEVRDANVKLATRLYEQCKNEKDDKNTVVSPLSVQLALASLNWGARGNTRRQIGHVIGGNLKTQERKQIFTTLVRHLKGLRNIDYTSGKHSTKINTVTGIFVSQRTRAQQKFIQQVKQTLGANVKHCSFSQQPQQCRQMINQFVSQKTQHKINHIVPQDCITDNTKMVLVNALELKATWGPEMRRHVTKQAKFYPLDTKKVKIVEVMETEGRFKYFEDELVKIVGVPTKQRELTLYTIVPKDKDGLTDVEKVHLQDSTQLKELLKKTDMHTRRVHVQLPKFQIKHKVDVRRTLRKQGVTDAFDSKRADFSGITGVNKYQEDEMEDVSIRRNPFLDIDTEFGMWGQQGQQRFRRNQFLDNEMEGGMWGQDSMGQRETKLHLNKFIHQCTIKITENGITATTGSQTDESYEQYGRMNQGRFGGLESEELNMFDETSGFGLRDSSSQNVVKANRAFAFVLKHNPTNQLVMVGRVIDAAQKKVNNIHQNINDVDQF